MLLATVTAIVGCSRKPQEISVVEIPEDSATLAADSVVPADTLKPGDSDYRFGSASELLVYMDTCSVPTGYEEGIIPVVAREVPDYADKLVRSKYDRFIVVDKASMRVILYDRFGHVEKSYDMACAKNYGTKHKKADARTPEGFFSVEGKYNSTDWLFTDDNGVTSKKKGQYGPRFIRIKIPNTSQIGIHGTCAPWSLGHRTSHGCIRIKNENILELFDLVEVGMPVIILPGKRDRKVNREEGYDIPYFPTDRKYAMTSTEKDETVLSEDEIVERNRLEAELEAGRQSESDNGDESPALPTDTLPHTLPVDTVETLRPAP